MNMEKSKWRYLWVLPIAMLVVASIPKIFLMDVMVQMYETSGIENVTLTLILLGSIELLCAVIFLIPKTRKIGFFLVTAFIGGIIAMEWIEPDATPLTGIILQVLLWAGMYFENPSLFYITPMDNKAPA